MRRSKQHILLFCPAFDDVEDPVQAALVTFALHVRTYMVGVDAGRLGNKTHGLRGILPDVGFGARIDEVDLEIGGLLHGS